MDNTQRGIILLLKSAVTGEKLELPAEFDLAEACRIMHRQSTLLMGYRGALNCGYSLQEPAMASMLKSYYMHTLINEKQMRMVDKLFETFEKHEIEYLPIKGCLLKKMYPSPELRLMGDADILIHPEDHERIAPLMDKLGFHLQNNNDHVFYWVSDGLKVELHKMLVPERYSKFYEYYGTGWRMAKARGGCRYELSDEDHFVFLFAHFARHYQSSGIGCRHVIDLRIFTEACPGMDMAYVERELETLGLLSFYRNVMRLLDVWFSGAEPDEITELISSFVFSGGNWGTREAYLYSQEIRHMAKENKVEHVKWKLVLRSVFPPRKLVRSKFPILDRVPLLLPMVWVIRWVDILLFRRGVISRKISDVQTVSDSDVLSHRQALNMVGLDVGA